VVLLAAAVLVAWRRAIAEALIRGGRLLPLMILTLLTVQSITGSDYAVFGFSTMLFMVVALSLPDPVSRRRGARDPSLLGLG